MGLKEKLQELRNNLQEDIFKNRDYEFDAELEDHPIGNQSIYRLYYIDYHRIGENYGMGPNNIGVINWPFKPFMLPDGMSREDAFKVLSYLTDFIEKDLNLESCSYKSVAMLDSAIDLERLGFKRLDIKLEGDFPEVINLFTITGRVLLFKKSKQYQKYFEWYVESVTKEEVEKIYNKIGIEFYDLVPQTKTNIDSSLKLTKRNNY